LPHVKLQTLGAPVHVARLILQSEEQPSPFVMLLSSH
jgi:hypothetical protein